MQVRGSLAAAVTGKGGDETGKEGEMDIPGEPTGEGGDSLLSWKDSYCIRI